MPLEAKIDPYLQEGADRGAFDWKRDVAASKAAIEALRNYPLNRAMIEDSNTPVDIVNEHMGAGVVGYYTPSKNRIKINANPDVGGTRDTLYHELLHGLQNQDRTDIPMWRRATASPGGVMKEYKEPALPGYEGSPKQFANAMIDRHMSYGPGEAAAFMAAGLNQPGKLDPNLRKVVAEYPGMSGKFAQEASQPNRPQPMHMKGYPEMSWMNQRLYDLGILGRGTEVDERAKYSAAQQRILRRLNEETNPRSRR